jgi:DNA primase
MPAIRRCPVPSDPVELTKQIKAASDIVAVVSSYLAVKPAGAIFKALCPFHNDSRPSLDIDPKRQRYRCWSCGAHGDSFAFVQHMEKVTFLEARAILATRAGIKLDEKVRSPEDQHKTRLLEVMKWAQAKYQHNLLEGEMGEAARKYLGGRKLSGKTVRDFGLGFAPLDGEWLVRAAFEEGIADEILVEVGLTAPSQAGRGYYDRFRDRVMFPIRDVRGQTIAFGGRIMPESPYASRAPKYYNSAETPLFSKSDVLYGLNMARHAGASAGYLAVVEGYTDVMMAHQCGVPQVVATMGTALNSRHVRQLSRFVKKVVLVFDADIAGDKAWHRGMEELLLAPDVEVAVARLPQGLDPCDLLSQADGSGVFRKALAEAKDALDYRLDWLLEKNPAPNVEASRRIVDDILGTLSIADPARSVQTQVKCQLIVTRLAHRLGLRQETVWARLSELRKERRLRQLETGSSAQIQSTTAARTIRADGEETAPGPKAGPAAAAERQLVEILLADPGLVPQAAAAIAPDEVTHSGLRRLLSELYRSQAAGAVPDLDWLREQLIDRPDLFEWAMKHQFIGQQMQEREQWLERLLKRFAEMKVKSEMTAYSSELKSTTDQEKKVELLRKMQQVYEKARYAQ